MLTSRTRTRTHTGAGAGSLGERALPVFPGSGDIALCVVVDLPVLWAFL